MTKSIKAALHDLDPKRDEDWTEGGLPSISRIKQLTGNNDVTRADISDAAPGFNRANAHAAPSDTETLSSRPKAGEAEGAKAGSAGGRRSDDDRAINEKPDPLFPVEGVPADNQPAGPDQHPGDRPIEEQGLGNPNDATNNAERRDPMGFASGGLTGKVDDPEYLSARKTDPDEVASMAKDADPIMLLEAVAAAAGHGRYARNSALQTIVRAYQVSQREIKEVQGRLDIRYEEREKMNADAERRAKDVARDEARS